MNIDSVLDLEEMLPVSSITKSGTVCEERKVALEPGPEPQPEPAPIVIDSDSEPELTDSSSTFVEKVNLDDANLRDLAVREIPKELLELDTLHRCFVCKSRFRSVDPMRHHLKLHARTVCLQCGERFYTIPELDWHRRAIHGEDFEFLKRMGSMFFCRICAVVGFLSMDDACEHLYACHDEFLVAALPEHDAKVIEGGSKVEEPQTYRVCSDAFSDPKCWQYYCDSCDVFITGVKFNAEHNEHHRNPRKTTAVPIFDCLHCVDSPRFKFLDEYSEHVKKHALQKIHDTRFYCLLCQKRFETESGIKRHIFEKHVRTTALTVACPYCPEAFTHLKSLAEHKWHVHRVRASFKCESCGEQFSSNLARIKHRREAHREDLEFRERFCRHCMQMFDTVEERAAHDAEVHKKKL
ncbi:zinc finger protein 91 [Culex quinquefasciatus]|uniref:zinc finger protein 91 n=1 Tax=Culex quinquefasciatus TaxID=7176 RepID=UPI0018E3BF63|nr:zinc finger protein 91 [Culex quinquefasciatus]